MTGIPPLVELIDVLLPVLVLIGPVLKPIGPVLNELLKPIGPVLREPPVPIDVPTVPVPVLAPVLIAPVELTVPGPNTPPNVAPVSDTAPRGRAELTSCAGASVPSDESPGSAAHPTTPRAKLMRIGETRHERMKRNMSSYLLVPRLFCTLGTTGPKGRARGSQAAP
jgi:hypothetical protein